MPDTKVHVRAQASHGNIAVLSHLKRVVPKIKCKVNFVSISLQLQLPLVSRLFSQRPGGYELVFFRCCFRRKTSLKCPLSLEFFLLGL